jgi:histidinol dehydrogenase
LRGQPSLLEGIRATFGEPLTPEQVVARIVGEVRLRGDAAVIDFTSRISGVRLSSLEVPRTAVAAAVDGLESSLYGALSLAASRIEQFHRATAVRLGVSWVNEELGRLILPLQRVGLYVPGGRYSYPSSVLMSAIPAKVAGVGEVIVATPPSTDGTVSPLTLAACAMAGVDRVFAVGGAQAIAALAYGTETIPRVDKICGPGNVFVTLAKKMVFGSVDIDSLAGPSEVLIIADGAASPVYCAADILAQAEHDPQTAVVLLTDSARLADRVERELDLQLAQLPSSSAPAEAVERGVLAVVESLAEAVKLSNQFAPEHLELLVGDPTALLTGIRNAGCICLGEQSPVVMGDYIDGPSHVLPTGGSARFSSVLGVHDFVKYSSVAQLGGATMTHLGPAAVVIARAERLEAHARAIEARLKRAGDAPS